MDLKKFEEYCQPCKNVPFERYCFNRQVQEPGEMYDQYRTALLKLAEGCEFQTITPDEILRETCIWNQGQQSKSETTQKVKTHLGGY